VAEEWRRRRRQLRTRILFIVFVTNTSQYDALDLDLDGLIPFVRTLQAIL